MKNPIIIDYLNLLFDKRLVKILIPVFISLILGITVIALQKPHELREHATGGFPHVSGSQLIDESGNPLLLHGAMMESAFAYINRWQKGDDPTVYLNAKTFSVMHSWNMNALRINTSQWIYNLNPTLYMQRLDKVITDATQNDLYVIIDFHDDTQSGAVAPYDDEMLHTVSIPWWQMMASHYKNNTKVFFDLINEPKYTSWQLWSYGNGNDVIGFVDAIKAIRSTGAQQIIVIEPGSAAGSQATGWTGYNPATLSDANILYSKHDYSEVVSGNTQKWDAEWGLLLGKYPLYYGEWAVLPYPNYPSFCKGLTSDNALQITTTFLDYMKEHQMNWTYWDFEPYRLIQDYTTYTPTSFQTGAPWICLSQSAQHAGAGITVKDYLLNITPSPLPSQLTPSPTFTPTPNTTVTPSILPSGTPTPTTSIIPKQGITLEFHVCLHGIFNCGDNANPNGGNTAPKHIQRNFYAELLNVQNVLLSSASGTVTYNPQNGDYSGTIIFPEIQSGNYIIKVATDGYLWKKIGKIQSLDTGQLNILPLTSLIVGDINMDNQIDITDYNLLISCFGVRANSNTCINSTLPDLNDDGFIDITDLNLFLREISVQRGD